MNSEEEKTVLPTNQKAEKYSSSLIKRGLSLANSLTQENNLTQENLEKVIQIASSNQGENQLNNQWSCIYTSESPAKEVDFYDNKPTVWRNDYYLAISPDSQILAISNEWGEVKLLALFTGEILHTINSPNRTNDGTEEIPSKYYLVILPDNQTLVCLNWEKASSWNLITREYKELFSSSHELGINYVNQTVAIVDDSKIRIYSLELGQLLKTIETDFSHIEYIEISPNLNYIAISGNKLLDYDFFYEFEFSVKIYDFLSKNLLFTLDQDSDTNFKKECSFILSTTDSKNLITVNISDHESDGYLIETIVKIWDLSNGGLLFRIYEKLEFFRIEKVILSHDRHLFIGSGDKSIKVWNLDSKNLLYTLAGHTDLITHLAVSPDGKKLASSSCDQTIKIWNLDKGELIQTLSEHCVEVKSISFSPDGQTIVSTDIQGTLKVWRMN